MQGAGRSRPAQRSTDGGKARPVDGQALVEGKPRAAAPAAAAEPRLPDPRKRRLEEDMEADRILQSRLAKKLKLRKVGPRIGSCNGA